MLGYPCSYYLNYSDGVPSVNKIFNLKSVSLPEKLVFRLPQAIAGLCCYPAVKQTSLVTAGPIKGR